MTATDPHGESTEVTRQMTVDAVPTIDVPSPTSNPTTEDVTVKVRVGDERSSLRTVTFDGAITRLFRTPEAGIFEASATLETGTKHEVTATDQRGQTGRENVSFYIDEEPDVRIESSRDLSTPVREGQTVTLTADPTDDKSIRALQWTVDGDVRHDGGPDPRFDKTIRGTYAPGTHMVRVDVTDTAGQTANATVSFTVKPNRRSNSSRCRTSSTRGRKRHSRRS